MGNRTEIVLATQDPPSSGGFKRNFWLNTATGKNFTWSADQNKYVEGGTGNGGTGNIVDTSGIGIGAIGLCLDGPSVGPSQYTPGFGTDRFITYTSTTNNVQLSVLPNTLKDYFLSSISPAYTTLSAASPLGQHVGVQYGTPEARAQKKCLGFFLWRNAQGNREVITGAYFSNTPYEQASPQLYKLSTSWSGNAYTQSVEEYKINYDTYAGEKIGYGDYWMFCTGANVYSNNFRLTPRDQVSAGWNQKYIKRPAQYAQLLGGFCIDPYFSTEMLIASNSGKTALYLSGFSPQASDTTGNAVDAAAWTQFYSTSDYIRNIGYFDKHYANDAGQDKLYVFVCHYPSIAAKLLICPHSNLGNVTAKSISASLIGQVYPSDKYDTPNNLCATTNNALPIEVSEDGQRIVISCPKGILTSSDAGDTWQANTNFRGVFKVRKETSPGSGSYVENFYSLHSSRLILRIDPSTGSMVSYNNYATSQYLQAVQEIANYIVPYTFNEDYRNYYMMPHFMYTDGMLFAASASPMYNNNSSFAFVVKNFDIIQDENAEEKLKTPNIMPVFPFYDGGSLKSTTTGSTYSMRYTSLQAGSTILSAEAGVMFGFQMDYPISNIVEYNGYQHFINRTTGELERFKLSDNTHSVLTSGAQLTTTGNLAITNDPYTNNKVYLACALPIGGNMAYYGNQYLLLIDPENGMVSAQSTMNIGYFNIFDVWNVSSYALCAYGGQNDGTDHLGTIRIITTSWDMQGQYGVLQTMWNFTSLHDTENLRVYSNAVKPYSAGRLSVDGIQIAIPYAFDSFRLITNGQQIGEFYSGGTAFGSFKGSRTPLDIHLYVCSFAGNGAPRDEELRFRVRSLGTDGNVYHTTIRIVFGNNLDNMLNGYYYFGYISSEEGDGVNQPRFEIVSDVVANNDTSVYLDRSSWENLYRTFEYGVASYFTVYIGDGNAKNSVTLPIINSSMTHYLQIAE